MAWFSQSQITDVAGSSKDDESNARESTPSLKEQLQQNLASLLLKLPSLCHVSQSATQEMLVNLDQLLLLSKPLMKQTVLQILEKHNCNVMSLMSSMKL